MNDLNSTCPICSEGVLAAEQGLNIVSYKGHEAELVQHYSVCNVCGSEQSSAVQLRTNKRLMVAFKKRVDGLLSGADVLAIRKLYGISQAEAARVFGGGPVAFSKYEHDDVAQSDAMDKLLRLARDLPASFSHLKVWASSGEGP